MFARMSGASDSYFQELAGAKPRSPIKPVIIPEFVNLDALANAGRLRLQRHDRARWKKGMWRYLVTPGLDVDVPAREESK